MAEKKKEGRFFDYGSGKSTIDSIFSWFEKNDPTDKANWNRKLNALKRRIDNADPTQAENYKRKYNKLKAMVEGRKSKATQEKQARGMAKMPSNSRTTAAKNRVQAEKKPASKPSTAADRRGSNATLKPKTKTATTKPTEAKNYNLGKSKGGVSFNEAFAHFRKKGQKTFTWNGEKYTTELASEKKSTKGKK